MTKRSRNDLDGIVPIDTQQIARDDKRKKVELVIGAVLLVLIIAGGVILLFQGRGFSSSTAKASSTGEIAALKAEIDNLNKKIDDLNRNIETAKAAASTATVESASSTSGSATTPAGKININTASASELDGLPGIGPTYAERIIEYRNSNGGFKTADELKNVKGIGDKTFDKLKDYVTI